MLRKRPYSCLLMINTLSGFKLEVFVDQPRIGAFDFSD